MNDVIHKMMMDMQVRGLSEGSQKEYVRCVEVFELFHGKPVTEVDEPD